MQSRDKMGKLTVVLDLDGTLISSFTPKRAPALPAAARSYVVGQGAQLNPNGVLVVERPGMRRFFERLNEFAGGCRVRGLGFGGPSLIPCSRISSYACCHFFSSGLGALVTSSTPAEIGVPLV